MRYRLYEYKEKGGFYMKKYVFCILSCLLMSTVFVGCSDSTDKEEKTTNISSEETAGTSEEEKDTSENDENANDENTNDESSDEVMNLEELFQKGMDSYAEKNVDPPVLFPETDMEYLENFYPGISVANIKQIYVAMAPVTNAPMEIALVEVTDDSDVAVIRDIFQERIDSRANDTTYPEESGVWKKNGIVTIRGNYIFMAVMTDDYGIPKEFILD